MATATETNDSPCMQILRREAAAMEMLYEKTPAKDGLPSLPEFLLSMEVNRMRAFKGVESIFHSRHYSAKICVTFKI
jgi:hypothetical protein